MDRTAEIIDALFLAATHVGRKKYDAAIGAVSYALAHLSLALMGDEHTPVGEPEADPNRTIWGHPISAYLSPIPWQGYDTVLGYLAKHDPEMIELMDDEPEATARDGWWLKHRCRERSLPVYKVPAPKVLQDRGIQYVNAYPVELLRERFN